MQRTLQCRKLLPFHNMYGNVFLICLVTAAIIFIPFMIADRGYFFYYGDFNVQQIPFYYSAHESVRSGSVFWDWGLDLGANFIGSYSFYLLSSPFFWLTLLFPVEAVPALLAPLLILKFACAGVTGFAFIKRFAKQEHFALLGAVLYAFSGFNQFNIFFNHFHEAVIVFPLLLVALEEFVLNRRRGCFALAVFACALVNYFFFVGQVVFTVIYFLLRCLSPDFRMGFRELGVLAFEAVLGVLLACAILAPSVLAILDNPRTSQLYYGMDILLYNNVQRYGLILESLFFPPDIPSRPNFFPDSNAKWSSVSLYLPLFSMTGVVVFIKNHKHHWLKRIIAVSLVMALIPFLNSAFFAFNSSYYARWFYMPLLMMSLATCLVIENATLDMKKGIRFCAVAVGVFSFIGLLPVLDSGEASWFGIPPYPERFWIYIIIAVVSLLILLLLLQIPRKSKRFYQFALLFTCLVSIVSSITVIATGRQHSTSEPYRKYIEQGVYGGDKFDLDDSSFFRVDTYEFEDNMPMYWGMSSVRCFHSIVPVSVMDFHESFESERNVASRPGLEYYGMRALASVRYLFCDAEIPEEDEPSMFGYEFIGIQNGLRVYENQYYIPMGFTYDYFADSEVLERFINSGRDKLMVRAMILSDEDAEAYSHLLSPLPDNGTGILGEERYYEDCRDRAATAGYAFTHDSRGFTSRIELDRENLVFYSVPYEDGWRAYVNGEEVPIVKANVGFMAVAAPAGDNVIEFRYMTPGLIPGIAVTAGAAAVLIGYLLLVRCLRKKAPEAAVVPYFHRNQSADLPENRMQRAYIYALLHRAKRPRPATPAQDTMETLQPPENHEI